MFHFGQGNAMPPSSFFPPVENDPSLSDEKEEDDGGERTLVFAWGGIYIFDPVLLTFHPHSRGYFNLKYTPAPPVPESANKPADGVSREDASARTSDLSSASSGPIFRFVPTLPQSSPTGENVNCNNQKPKPMPKARFVMESDGTEEIAPGGPLLEIPIHKGMRLHPREHFVGPPTTDEMMFLGEHEGMNTLFCVKFRSVEEMKDFHRIFELVQDEMHA